MQDKKYYVVKFLKNIIDEEMLDSYKKLAFEEFYCAGVEEFSMDESTVDSTLGEEAFCGGNIRDELLEVITEHSNNEPMQEVVFFFYEGNAQNNAELFAEKIRENIREVRVESYHWEDWNTNWRKNFTTIKINEKLAIVPEWESNSYSDKQTPIIIYPGQGFGTGNHETTFMSLDLLSQVLLPGEPKNGQQRMALDFGCGSGILGIAFLKLYPQGAVTFCDIDREALDNAKYNLELNFDIAGLTGSKLVSRDRFKIDQKYDVILANILKPILIEEKDVFINSIQNDGNLIISGILVSEMKEMRTFFEKLGFRCLSENTKGDWGAILFQKQ